MILDTEIFFTSSERGQAWYVWTRSAAQAYFFTSMDNALRFAGLIASGAKPAADTGPANSLEQAATLI